MDFDDMKESVFHIMANLEKNHKDLSAFMKKFNNAIVDALNERPSDLDIEDMIDLFDNAVTNSFHYCVNAHVFMVVALSRSKLAR